MAYAKAQRLQHMGHLLKRDVEDNMAGKESGTMQEVRAFLGSVNKRAGRALSPVNCDCNRAGRLTQRLDEDREGCEIQKTKKLQQMLEEGAAG